MSAGEGEEGSVDCGEVHGVNMSVVGFVCERGFRLVLLPTLAYGGNDFGWLDRP